MEAKSQRLIGKISKKEICKKLAEKSDFGTKEASKK